MLEVELWNWNCESEHVQFSWAACVPWAIFFRGGGGGGVTITNTMQWKLIYKFEVFVIF